MTSQDILETFHALVSGGMSRGEALAVVVALIRNGRTVARR